MIGEGEKKGEINLLHLENVHICALPQPTVLINSHNNLRIYIIVETRFMIQKRIVASLKPFSIKNFWSEYSQSFASIRKIISSFLKLNT